MGEILQLSSSSSTSIKPFQLKKHQKQLDCDIISKLPDEVLCSIVSHLTLNEAARTCVLSYRWKTLWYSFHGTMHIDAPNKINIFPVETRSDALYDYLSSTSRVLPLLLSPFLDSFIVRFHNLNRCTPYLDLWVQYAMKKRIKNIVIDAYPEPIAFPCGSLYNLSSEFYDWIKKPCGLDNISSLTSISLNRVNVFDNLIHHLLVNCPLLESLRVTDSLKLLNPKFIGGTTLLKLKYLEISGFKLESVEICAPNLLTFITRGKKVKLYIKSAPKLVQLSFSVDIINDNPESVSSYLPHLQRLTLDFGIDNGTTTLMHQFHEQNKLQHLTWKVGIYHDEYTVELNSLMDASPFLHKFTLVIFLNERSTHEVVPNVTAKQPHQCLKVLEIDGFTGADSEVKLVKYFIENTTSLEEIILDIRGPFSRKTLWKGHPTKLKRSKKCALGLKKHIPPRVSLVILE